MLDFANIEKYRENNRIEAKKALGGFPHSIWETYSAFANTMGGIILLGVEEYRDKTFHTVDLPNPEALVKEFFAGLNDRKTVNVNIISENDVKIHEIDGNHIIAINVPRARRADKPVYIGTDPNSGTYRRNGEGDYRCTPEEISAMMRDSEFRSADLRSAEGADISDFDLESIKDYCLRIGKDSISEYARFLTDIGVINSEGGSLKPSVAGLLTFGKNDKIVEKFPKFSLEYIENGIELRGKNLWDFYVFVSDKLSKMSDEVSVCDALREALANCLTNADYNANGGIVVSYRDGAVSFSNPGGLRIDVDTAIGGGVSDPRNEAIAKIFNLARIGKGRGRGISSIYRTWKKQGFAAPVFEEGFEPDRVTLVLDLGHSRVDKHIGKKITAHIKDVITDYLTVNISATLEEISQLLGISQDVADKMLSELIDEEIIICEGDRNCGIYKLRA